jgi:hypothetical protein
MHESLHVSLSAPDDFFDERRRPNKTELSIEIVLRGEASRVDTNNPVASPPPR